MKNRRKLCVITGTRAESGLLTCLMRAIEDDQGLDLLVVATGMHLSPEFGLTWKQIESAGFSIHRKVEMLISSDTPVGVIKSMGLGLIGFADAFEELKPDMIIVLGDRFEIFSAVAAALIARIPVAHIHGGELTEGAFDDSIRHSITKMSHLHFTASEKYRKRVIQLGEEPDRVFNVGAIGLDNIDQLKLMGQDDFEHSIRFNLAERNLLITFHPITLEPNSTRQYFQNLLEALDNLDNTHFIFTKPNADPEGRVIVEMIDDYVAGHQENSIAFVSMGQLRYLSALQFVDAVVGNSSSGIIEAPSFGIGTINIGSRQKGRVKAESVIDCEPSSESITAAFVKLYSSQFQACLQSVKNPFGDGGAAKKIVQVLRQFPLEYIIKKTFFDLDLSGY